MVVLLLVDIGSAFIEGSYSTTIYFFSGRRYMWRPRLVLLKFVGSWSFMVQMYEKVMLEEIWPKMSWELMDAMCLINLRSFASCETHVSRRMALIVNCRRLKELIGQL